MKESIKKKFNFSLVAIIIFIILSISLPLIVFNSRSMNQNLNRRILQLVKFSKETLPAALWQYNYEYANEFIASLFLYEDVVFATLIVKNDEIVKKARPKFQSYSFQWFKSSKDFVTQEARILYKDKTVGRIHLVFSREQIKRSTLNNLMLSFFIIVLLIVGVLVTNIKMSNWYIFDPLFSLEESVKKISKGALDTKILIDRKDEIGQLANSFEKMMINLKIITASRDELNHEISKRKQTEKKYRDLFENAQIGMFQSRINDGKMMVSNLRMAQIFGYDSPEECISNYVAEKHYVYSYQREEVVRLLKETGEIVNYQAQIRLSDGTIKWIQFSGTTVDDKNFFKGVAADITEQKIAEQKVQSSLEEKEILLKEIHHRVKNNLQMIQSLLSLQSNQIKDPENKKAFADSSSRIKSMSLIHETLYHSEDIAKLDVNKYITDIVDYLKKIYFNPDIDIEIDIHVNEIDMNLDHCISCGLIINELISNSLKYAFRGRKKGNILLTLKQTNSNLVELVISDDGCGFETLKNIDEYSSLGLRIVNIIVKGQLKGTIDISNEKGVSCIINIPINDIG
jgi:PAS domain S-box-containing protein